VFDTNHTITEPLRVTGLLLIPSEKNGFCHLIPPE
jgi:hypothetical protein